MHDDEYVSYLLRLYKSEWQGQTVWRTSLENTRTGERRYFQLEGLLRYLRVHYGPGRGEETDPGESIPGAQGEEAGPGESIQEAEGEETDLGESIQEAQGEQTVV